MKHRLEDMTFVEFRERIDDELVVLIPLGSQEEQGPMAPMGDFMLTQAVADRIAVAADAVVAPILPFGYADYFRPVPGGIALRAETFAAVLEDVCVNFLDHGLERLVILNGHTGNFPLVDQVLRKLKRDRGVVIPCLNLWRQIPARLWTELHPEVGAAALGHGADPLTSLYLHLFPERMRMDLAEAAAPPGELLGLRAKGLANVVFGDLEVNAPVDVTDATSNGITGGDPRRSSAAIGERIVEHLVAAIGAFVVHMRTAPVTTKGGNPS